jgi:hypothetical protein
MEFLKYLCHAEGRSVPPIVEVGTALFFVATHGVNESIQEAIEDSLESLECCRDETTLSGIRNSEKHETVM